MKPREKLNWILAAFFLSAALLVIISVATWFTFNNLFSITEAAIRAHLNSAVTAAANYIRVEELDMYHTADDTRRPEYEKLRERLQRFGDAHGITYVYYWRMTKDGDGRFIVDNDAETRVGPGTAVTLTKLELSAAAGSDVVMSEIEKIYAPAWDGLLTAYLPMFFEDGTLAAIAGVDIQDDSIMTQRRASIAIVIFLSVTLACAFFSAFAGIYFLRKRVRQIELLNQTKTHFLATVSHEIRTPLNAIIGLAQIQSKKNIPENTLADFDKILQSGFTLLNIVNDMLDITKIESGNFELVCADYEIPSMINDTVQLNIARIGTKPVLFYLEIDETIPLKLYGDERRVKQVLNNVLSNAFKYTRHGSVTLRVGWEKAGENELFLAAEVRDTGIGIKKEDLQKIFFEYARFDKIASRKIEGAGLGLSITKKLIEMMNGSITVQSEYGKGSCFAIKMLQKVRSFEPSIGKEIVNSLKSARCHDKKQDSIKNLKRSYMPSAHVLVVDDVATNLEVARVLLEPYGISVDCVLSGQEAIDLIRKRAVEYNAIFMDHMMPGMDGMETVRIIRNQLDSDYAKNVPIIALTANALTGNENMFLRNGFSDFISKPIDLAALDAVLNKFLRGAQGKKTLEKQEQYQKEITAAPALDEEIDFTAGIERYSSKAVYLDILGTYARTTPKLLESLESLAPNTLANYAITVHGLKSASFGIFAFQLAKQAEELEALAKAGDYAAVSEKNAGFIARARTILETIGRFTAESDSAKAKKETRDSIDEALLKQMYDANKMFKNASLEELFAEMQKYEYAAARDSELVSFLSEQIDNLEYEKIAQALENRLGQS
jgi:signal transduction histidine kinase/CheY-like chemotaxis protein